MDIKYAIIPPLGQSPVQTSEERTKGIAVEYRKLNMETYNSNVNIVVSQHGAGWISNAADNTEFAIQMDLDFMLNVSVGFNTGFLFQLYGQFVDGTERAAINGKINAAVGGKIAISEIIPASWVLHTEADMITLGWIVPL